MNCIFICVFHQTQYIDMLFLLLESIFIYGNLDETTHILIYTNTEFKNRIQKSHLYNNHIRFAINDTYQCIDSSCKARLDYFHLDDVKQYEKVLYLDTDILIKRDLNKIFDICKKEILYTLEEGFIDHVSDFWGRRLFGKESDLYTDKSAFTSGVLLFPNCETIRDLFSIINTHIQTLNDKSFFHDQPFFVYNAFKYQLYDNKVLKPYVVNLSKDIHSDKTIHHFPGGPGIYGHKIDTMRSFLAQLKDYTITNHIQTAKLYIDNHLLPIIRGCRELLEGNIFMVHHTTEYTDIFINKAKNISNLLLNRHITDVMEIGFNAGFSALLMLISNPNIHLTCFDLAEHSYTMPCYQKLRETFGNRIRLVPGDSMKTVATATGSYGLIHIDGGHNNDVAESDIINSYRLSRKGTVLIMDDYDFPNLHALWDGYIKSYHLSTLDIMLYYSPHHDIRVVS